MNKYLFSTINEELHSKLSKADSLDMLDAYKVEEYDSGKYLLYINSNVKTMHSTCIYIAPMSLADDVGDEDGFVDCHSESLSLRAEILI